jgi:hypothetical protein
VWTEAVGTQASWSCPHVLLYFVTSTDHLSEPLCVPVNRRVSVSGRQLVHCRCRLFFLLSWPNDHVIRSCPSVAESTGLDSSIHLPLEGKLINALCLC